jgi:hypothetical protein
MKNTYVLIPKFADHTGYTPKAIRRKMEAGVWRENVHYIKAPDGRISFSLEAHSRWVEGAKEVELKSANTAYE